MGWGGPERRAPTAAQCHPLGQASARLSCPGIFSAQLTRGMKGPRESQPPAGRCASMGPWYWGQGRLLSEVPATALGTKCPRVPSGVRGWAGSGEEPGRGQQGGPWWRCRSRTAGPVLSIAMPPMGPQAGSPDFPRELKRFQEVGLSLPRGRAADRLSPTPWGSRSTLSAWMLPMALSASGRGYREAVHTPRVRCFYFIYQQYRARKTPGEEGREARRDGGRQEGLPGPRFPLYAPNPGQGSPSPCSHTQRKKTKRKSK